VLLVVLHSLDPSRSPDSEVIQVWVDGGSRSLLRVSSVPKIGEVFADRAVVRVVDRQMEVQLRD
jgi:hypothetical protein